MNRSASLETLQDLSRGPSQNLFSGMDHHIVRKALSGLTGTEHAVILLRFWEKNTISEIGEILDMDWNEVEACLKQAMEKVKTSCLKDSKFSRSEKTQMDSREVA